MVQTPLPSRKDFKVVNGVDDMCAIPSPFNVLCNRFSIRYPDLICHPNDLIYRSNIPGAQVRAP
jgi:hypothetical protein